MLFWKRKKTVKNNKPTVVQLVSYYPPHLGGMEIVAEELSKELANQNHTVQVFTSNIGAYDEDTDIIPNLSVSRLKSFEFAHTPFIPMLMWKLLRVKKPAIFHIHLSQAFLPEVAWLVAKIRHIPYVIHFHLDVQPSGRLGFLFVIYKKTIQKLVINGAKAVITLSDEQKTMIENDYSVNPEDVFFVPNGVSSSFLAIGNKPRKPHKKIKLLFVGRLTIQKRVDRLIRSLALSSSNIELHIVGDGEDRKELEELKNELKLKNITFHGAKRGKDLLKIYESCDIFVLPSDKEGMPLVMLEAMATGMPVIGSDVQGIREHLKGVGVLVKDPSPETFARTIDDFINGISGKYSEYSNKSVRKASSLSWAILTKKIVSIYEKVGTKKTRHNNNVIKLFTAVAIWWVSFLILRQFSQVPNFIINAIGFSFILIAPGLLTLLAFKLRFKDTWGNFAIIVGLSLLELMLTGLIGNTLLQLVGVERPLDSISIIAQISILLIGLMVIIWQRHISIADIGINKSITVLRNMYPSYLDLYSAFFPIILVTLAAIGSISLNNGGTNFWTMLMIALLATHSIFIGIKSKKLASNTIPTAIFFMALSLLLMTSLRGWYTTGHDVQREFRVFELARSNGIWKIQAFRDAYNACLSITILPTMFANLLRFVDPYVYKIFFQIIFAICPAVIYLLIRKWTAPIYAFAATMYFIAFPTFFNDMPMLNRQEIAFLFFTLMLYTAFQDEIKLRYRRWLFLLLSVGLVISHYSTTYSVVIILLSSAIFWPLIRKAGKKLQKLSIFKNSAYSAIQNSHGEIKRITISMVVIIFSLSFLWTTILTNTGGNTLRIIKETVIAATNGFKDDTAKSADTNYNIFSWQKLDAQKQLDTYVQKVVEPSRKSSPNIYYNQNTYSSFAIKPSDSNVMPQTQLGVFFSKHIMNVETFNFSVRQGSAKLIQILMLVGLIFLLFKRKYTNLVDTDLVALSIGAIIFLILQVVLPILSIEYGLLRAFQQSLIVLSLFVVMGSVALFKLIPKYGKKPLLSLLVAVAFLISSTGFVTQLLGGYYAQLNLNNSGTYYDIYYLHRSEVLGIKWLADNVSRTNINGDEVQAEVQTDRYSFSKVNSISDVSAINDIYPGLIRKDSYVYLGFSNVNKEQATISYTGNLLTYTYPVQFLDNNKDLIYNNGSARIYR